MCYDTEHLGGGEGLSGRLTFTVSQSDDVKQRRKPGQRSAEVEEGRARPAKEPAKAE